jgi:hypothetical protein
LGKTTKEEKTATTAKKQQQSKVLESCHDYFLN